MLLKGIWTDKEITMRKISFLVLTYILSCSVSFAISTCTDIIQQMDIHTKEASKNTKKYPWSDFTWIATVFGDAQVTPIKQERFVWGKYNLIVRNGQVYDENGPKPKALAKYKFAPTLEQAVAALGKPKKESSEMLNEYRWACTDTSSMLDIIANNDNKIVSSSFFYCDSLRDTGCSYGHLG